MNNKYKFTLTGLITIIFNIVFLASIIIFDVKYGVDARLRAYAIIGLLIILTTLASFRKDTFGCGFLIAAMFATASSVCLFVRIDNDKYFNRAVEYYNNGEYDKALDEFTLIRNYGPTEEYIETETVVKLKLKGTDECVIIEDK